MERVVVEKSILTVKVMAVLLGLLSAVFSLLNGAADLSFGALDLGTAAWFLTLAGSVVVAVLGGMLRADLDFEPRKALDRLATASLLTFVAAIFSGYGPALLFSVVFFYALSTRKKLKTYEAEAAQ